MAKAQLIAQFATEIAPSQLSSIVRRRRALPRRLDTIAEDEKEAAVELSSYALLHAKASRQNLSYTKEAGKSAVNGGKRSVAGGPSAHGKKPAFNSSPSMA